MIDLFNYAINKVLPLTYDNSLSYYEVLMKVLSKINEIIESTNGIDQKFNDLWAAKENKDDLTNLRKLSPTGDFTGSILGNPVMQVLAWILTNSDKIHYLTSQFSDGQTGFVIDGGFFEETAISHNYNGGIWS